MTPVLTETVVTGDWVQYTASLASFKGQSNVYIAIRHYNITDMFYLDIDLVQVLDNLSEAEPGAHTSINAGPVKETEAKTYQAPDTSALRIARVGDGYAVASLNLSNGMVEMVKFSETANNSIGGLNATATEVRNAVTAELPKADLNADEAETAEDATVVTITEDVEVTNGLYKVTYDPEKLTYVSSECEHEISSIHVDEEKGEITLAFAELDAIAAGETLATVNFTVSCEDTEVTVTTEERNDELDLSETETIDCEGTGHDWGEPEWTWSEDYTKATAKFVCNNNEEHVKEIEAVVTTETTDATCEEDGKTVYTATVELDGETYTDTKTVTLPAMGHDWGEPVWTWSDDHKTATATFTCKNCGEVKTVTDEAILVETDKDGKVTYTASIVGPDGNTYTDTYTSGVPTGDTMNLSLYICLLTISAAGAIVLLRGLKKKEN
jgi:hypothetical protein